MSDKLLSLFLLLTISTIASSEFVAPSAFSKSAEFGAIPTDKNFTVDTFIGAWNVVGVYKIPSIGLHSCPRVEVAKGALTTISLSLSYINPDGSTFNISTRTYQPSPLNSAILVDISTPLQRQDLVVSYYDDKLGQALLINTDSSFAIVLSKSENIYTNFFLSTVGRIFTQAGLNISQLAAPSSFGCSSNFTVASGFTAKAFPGNYYGNAMFTQSAIFKNLTCYNIKVTNAQKNQFNITQYLKYEQSSSNVSSIYLQSPSDAGFLINVGQALGPSLVVNYYDVKNNVYILMNHQGRYGFVISQKTKLDSNVLSAVKQYLQGEGLVINDNTFYAVPKSCSV